jgi:hypothetical protein
MSYGTNDPNGFVPVDTLSNPGSLGITRTAIISAAGGAIFQNDAVLRAATGFIAQGTAGAANLMGVFSSCTYYLPTTVVPSGSNLIRSNTYPGAVPVQAGTAVTGYVYVDPSILYDVQADGTAVAAGYAFADLGATANLVANVGDSSTGISNMALGAVGIAANLNFKIFDFSQSTIAGATNASGVPFNNVLVTINTWLYGTNAAGI